MECEHLKRSCIPKTIEAQETSKTNTTKPITHEEPKQETAYRGAASEPVEAALTADLNRLAYAVAKAETNNCTTGTGTTHNNCFGLRQSSIRPCTLKGSYCVFESTRESFEMFKEVWAKGYGGRFPTFADAKVWTGGDRVDNWINIIHEYY